MNRPSPQDEFEAARISLYGGYAGRLIRFGLYAGYAKNWHDVRRDNPALNFSNRGKYDDDVFSTGLELGKVVKLQNGGRLGTGVTAQLSQRLSVGIDYDYEVWEHCDRHNLVHQIKFQAKTNYDQLFR